MTMKKMVIGVVGMPGAGKSLAIDGLREGCAASTVNMGDMVRAQVRARGLPLVPEELGKMAALLREERGPDAVALLTIEQVDALLPDHDLVIIDGIRSLHEVDTFRARWPMPVVAVHAPPTTRHARLMQRGREDDRPTIAHCMERDARELGFGIGAVIAMADAMLINDATTSIDGLKQATADAILQLTRGEVN